MNFKEELSSPLKLYTNINCVNCNSRFNIKDVNSRGSRCPMLLQCGHTVCESCLQRSLKVTRNIMCQECKFISCPNSEEDFCYVSIQILGKLTANQHYKYGREKKFMLLMQNYSEFDYSVQGLPCSSESSGELIFCEECSFPASCFCENCRSNFCEICWLKVHDSAKSLKKHCKNDLRGSSFRKVGSRKCSKHETQDLEFFCSSCSITICAHCVILQHQGDGHSPITLKEKNLEMLSKLKTCAEEAEKIRTIMRKTNEDIKRTQDAFVEVSTKTMSNFENQIQKNFSRIHGILQLEEERCLKKLRQVTLGRDGSLKRLAEQLETQMRVLESLLNEYSYGLENPQCSDLTTLYQQLKEVKNMPCYLIVQKADPKEAKVSFDDRLIEAIHSYCSVEVPESTVFELRSIGDVPEGLINLEAEFRSSGFDSAEDSCSRGRHIDDEQEEPSSTQKTGSPKVFCEKKNYSVRVSYVKNPGEFYITLNSQRMKQQDIEKRALEVASYSFVAPKTALKDELFLVKSNGSKNWYRGRVVETLFQESGVEESVLIYYLDYGNCEVVPLSRLRPMTRDLEEDMPLAVKCKLFECVPKEDEWGVESTETMRKILSNYTATMYVMKVNPDSLEVDLSVMYPEGQIGRDIVSVRDALVFLEMASFVTGSKIPQNALAFKYLRQCLPFFAEVFDCIITHVNLPSDFYVQKVRQENACAMRLSVDLQEYYVKNSHKGMIYNPMIGMPCAALFSADHNWYRAKIVDIPGKKMVTVFYVDYGNTETLPWTSVRKLKEIFTKTPPMALNCELAGVPPNFDWGSEAKLYLEKCVLVKGFRAQIQDKPTSHQKLKVILLRRTKNKEIIVNDLLLEMSSTANSFSSLSTNSSSPSKVVETGQTVKDSSFSFKDRFEMGIDGCTTNPAFKGRRKPKLSAKKLKELHENKKITKSEKTEEGEWEKEVDESDNVYRVRIDVLSAESPSTIYVTFPALMKELEELQEKLMEFYKASEPVPGKDWAVGSICAVYSSRRFSWYRASVLSFLSENSVKVFLKDIAQVSTEPMSSLRELDPSFKSFATCAVKCHLADIGPPGDEWPTVSSEFLLSELDNYPDVYMTKKGEIDKQSLPIELWVKKIIPRGALEPTEKVWITLNDILVNEGLAVPLKLKTLLSVVPGHKSSEEGSPSPPSLPQPDAPAEKCLLASPPAQWLPPEPLTSLCFIGVPTYVDIDANLYIFDVEHEKKKLKTVCDSLLNDFRDSDPEDCVWTAKERCIARYHADGLWYRGVILENNEDSTYEVLFVDYGNIETCVKSDLRKEIRHEDIPILTRKFRLQDIEPLSSDGKWPVAILEIVHSIVVDKECQVTVLKLSQDPNEASAISLKIIESDIEVGTFLVEQGLAVKSCPSNNDFSPLPSEALSLDLTEPEAGDQDPQYVSLDIPADCDGFFLQVTAVTSENEFFANIVDEPNLHPSLKSVLIEFRRLEEQLMVEGNSEPPLESFFTGQPCCFLCPSSKKWWRGEVDIIKSEDDSVRVTYVDLGGKEYVAKDLVHKCKTEWLNLPKMALKLKLANVGRHSSASESVYMETLSKCLMEMTCFAKLVKDEEVLQVEVFAKGDGPLVYQEMIDDGLMTYTKGAAKK